MVINNNNYRLFVSVLIEIIKPRSKMLSLISLLITFSL